MSAAWALVISTGIGAVALGLLLRGAATPRPTSADAFSWFGLSFVMGLGLVSVVSFLGVAFAPGNVVLAIGAEWLILVIPAAAIVIAPRIRRRSSAGPSAVGSARLLTWAPIGLPIGLLAVMTAAWTIRGMLSPHGGWDAWALWNLRARFLFHGGEHWQNHYDPALLGWAHADYPMLLPLSVMRLWRYAGEATTGAPVLLAASFAAATGMLLIGAVHRERGAAAAAVAGLALLGLPFFSEQVPGQLADIPVGAFMLAGLVLVFHALRGQTVGCWIAAGLCAGCAAWTKREGSLFVVAMALGVLAALGPRRTSMRALLAWLMGAAPMLAILGSFRLAFPLRGEAKSIALAWDKLIDLDRHAIIWSRSWTVLAPEAPAWGALIIAMIGCGLAFGIDPARAGGRMARAACVTLTTMSVGYYAVYLLTPFDLTYIVDTTLTRLLVQLWPISVFTFCSMLREPGACGSAAAEEQDPESIGSHHRRRSDLPDRGVVVADP